MHNMNVKTTTKEKTINDIMRWIDNNTESKLSIDIITEKSGYSKWHLQRIFKQHVGVTLGEYIRISRIYCVAEKLRLSQESIMAIAIRYHYDSQQTLTRIFKYYFKTTPSAYRKSNNIAPNYKN